MNLFDRKFVYFMCDDSLEGKEGFFADCIDTLVERVNNNIRGTVGAYQVFGTCSYGVDSYPFSVNNTCGRYRFFYYDPNYSCKRAYMEGKVIQFRHRYDGDSGEWKPCEPQWRDECEYRVMPKEPKKKWRPFKDIVELKQAWNFKRGPIIHSDIEEPTIWVRDKKRPDITRLITDFNAGSKCVASAGGRRGIQNF